MTSAGLRPQTETTRGLALSGSSASTPATARVNLHGQTWARFMAFLGTRASDAGPVDVLLHGPSGIGKSYLLRRFYWEAFDGQDAQIPLIATAPPAPFRPAEWSRRFLSEIAQQWAAFVFRDPALAEANALAPSRLVEICHRARLAPLADALTEFEEVAASAGAGAFAVRWAFETVAHAAVALGHRAILMLDGVENAFWSEGGGTLHLAGVVEPLDDASSALRRIWTGRTAPRGAHPFLPPVPVTGDQWEVQPLPFEAAAEYAARLAREVRLDYDNYLLNDCLGLWGGIPRWLANFVRKAAESPRPLTVTDQFLQFYLEDILTGGTAQFLGRALNPPVGAFFEPATIARVAEKCLAQEGGTQRRTLVASTSFAAVDRPVLERNGDQAPSAGRNAASGP